MNGEQNEMPVFWHSNTREMGLPMPLQREPQPV